MKLRFATLLIAAGALLLGATAAQAGRRCEAAKPTPQVIERGLNLAQRTAAALDAAHARDGTRVVLLARAGQQVKAGTGADITHIPYKGGGQQINDALGGQFEVLSVNAGPAVMGHIKAGKLKPLAVGSPARLEQLPNVPTLAELGLPAANVASVFGLFAPAGTPVAVIERLNAEVNKLLKDKDVLAKIDAADNLPTGGSAADFGKFIANESANNARIIKAAGITAG